jgi:hypothetical protein
MWGIMPIDKEIDQFVNAVGAYEPLFLLIADS